jgi:DNA-3-methyladenine glycosylase II
MTREVKEAAPEIKGKRLKRALDHLAQADRDLARLIEEIGPPPPRGEPPGFAALLGIIVSQQVSNGAAQAIWDRLEAALDGEPTPKRLRALDEEALRAAGLSRQKVTYARGLADEILFGRLDLAVVARLPDDDVIAALTQVKGIGRWSAEIYLLFALNRPDVMPANDLALVLSAQRLKRLRVRPSPERLLRLAEPWRPWRSVAARLLWHYYRTF